MGDDARQALGNACQLAGSADEYAQELLTISKPDWHQLLILGNGFDLECGLRSSFADFEVNRECELELQNVVLHENIGQWLDYLIKENITIWDIILLQKKESLWSDIEAAIRDSVLDVSKHSIGELVDWRISSKWEKQIRSNLSFVQKWAMALLDLRETARKEFGKENIEGIDELILLYLVKILDNNNVEAVDERKLSRVMLDQLHILEDEFANYLNQQISNKYYSNSLRLISEILIYGQPSKDKYRIHSSLINFNYTDPLKNMKNKYEIFSDSITNIHGSLADGKIIFGIDGMGCMSDENTMPFTKTYRLMQCNRAIKTDLFYGPVKGDKQRVTKVIKFYGHSLSPADYSYFQSIFDDVDLYAGDTKLIFFYRPPKNDGGQKGDPEKARSDMVRKVVRLINSYGSTLDNVDHGENMLHKLLLEGRLNIIELPRYIAI
ncbi:Bacteriophage abortive infection AbiH [Bifidobacterium animalis subsp. lactis]|nr:Bacteriophage abortive infection AbiH [Bifidobacterium animalis subsp. lactis]